MASSSIPIAIATALLVTAPACSSHPRARPDAGGGKTKTLAGSGGTASSGGADPAASVLQHHNHAARDGVYVDAKLTKHAVAALHIDPSFAGAAIEGPTYAQPLYLAGSGDRPDLVLVATERNHVYAFDAASGKTVWDRTLGAPVPRAQLPCGNIDPLGVTGTPVIDPSTRTLYLDAMMSVSGAAHHRVFALDADTGKTASGWPVDLNATATAGDTKFDSLVQNQRGALALLDGSVFVPFGGHLGDCGPYHGWIIGIPVGDPGHVRAWATRAIAGGVWAPGGIASDGTSLFFATGNTESSPNHFDAPSSWQDGNAVFRLPPSLVFSGQAADYFVPSNWQQLDNTDRDLGGSNPILFQLAGATPAELVIALGKDGDAYVLDRKHLGGIGSPLAQASVAQGAIINAPAAYTTPKASYVVFKGQGQGCPSGQHGGLTAIAISAAAPPAISVAWCGGPNAAASPAVSMSDETGNDAIVWIVGTDNKLHGLDGDTGQPVFDGGTSAMSSVQKFQTPIVTGGRIFVAANDRVYAFTP